MRVVLRGPAGTPVHEVGAVGEITSSPSDVWHAYRVRFPDGSEHAVSRRDLVVLSRWNAGDDGLGPDADGLREYVIYRCVVGSRAFGLDDADSDTDLRGVYLPPARLHWSLYGVPEQLERPDHEECYWEIQKFLTLALKANPNVLECLFTPIVEHADETAREMLAVRECFLSRLVYQTFNGYVLSQFKKLQADLRNRGEVKWKHVMHLLRLLLSGIHTLETGTMQVRVPDGLRDRLLAVKRGEVPFAELEVWRLELHARFDRAAATTTLPERPDYRTVNDLLLRARRRMVDV